MKKNRLFLLLFTVFLLAACQRNSEISIKPDTNSYDVNQDELTDEEKDIVENGYVVDGYRILLMDKQKESLKDIKMYLAYNYFEDDFIKQKNLIDQSKKINILTYAMSYDELATLFCTKIIRSLFLLSSYFILDQATCLNSQSNR